MKQISSRDVIDDVAVVVAGDVLFLIAYVC